jgi:hypothetical protein
MASSLIPDPMQFWRDAVTRLENDFNSAATGSLKSQELMRALHQFSNASMGMQQLFEKAVEGYLRRANLPSRKEVAELAESLRRIEDKLDQLVPGGSGGGPSGGARPARTRRPPGETLTPAPDAAPAGEAASAPMQAKAPAKAAASASAKAAKTAKAPSRGAARSRSRGKP